MEESYSGVTIVITITREASLHTLQSQNPYHSLTVVVKKERNKKNQELTGTEPTQLPKQSPLWVRNLSIQQPMKTDRGSRNAHLSGWNIGIQTSPSQQCPYRPQRRHCRHPLPVRSRTQKGHLGQTVALSALANEGQLRYAELQKLNRDLEQTGARLAWSLNQTKEVMAQLVQQA